MKRGGRGEKKESERRERWRENRDKGKGERGQRVSEWKDMEKRRERDGGR